MKKKRLNTTLWEESYQILQKYEKDFGGKNLVIERALKVMDQTIHKSKIETSDIKVVKRKSSGIEGLDEMIEGGIPENFIVIVTGPPGTGKTTLSMQFLIEGIKNYEKCLFFSYEESAAQIINHCRRFGWNLAKYIKDRRLELFGFSNISIEEALNILEIYNPSRLVFDSIKVLLQKNEIETRQDSMMRALLKLIKKESITTIITTEKNYGIFALKFDQFDFMGDSIIFMDKIIHDGIDRFILKVQKMRGTRIDSKIKLFEITENGIKIYCNAPPPLTRVVFSKKSYNSPWQ